MRLCRLSCLYLGVGYILIRNRQETVYICDCHCQGPYISIVSIARNSAICLPDLEGISTCLRKGNTVKLPCTAAGYGNLCLLRKRRPFWILCIFCKNEGKSLVFRRISRYHLLNLRSISCLCYLVVIFKSCRHLIVSLISLRISMAPDCKLAVYILYYHRQFPLAAVIFIPVCLGVFLCKEEGIGACLRKGDICKLPAARSCYACLGASKLCALLVFGVCLQQEGKDLLRRSCFSRQGFAHLGRIGGRFCPIRIRKYCVFQLLHRRAIYALRIGVALYCKLALHVLHFYCQRPLAFVILIPVCSRIFLRNEESIRTRLRKGDGCKLRAARSDYACLVFSKLCALLVFGVCLQQEGKGLLRRPGISRQGFAHLGRIGGRFRPIRIGKYRILCLRYCRICVCLCIGMLCNHKLAVLILHLYIQIPCISVICVARFTSALLIEFEVIFPCCCKLDGLEASCLLACYGCLKTAGKFIACGIVCRILKHKGKCLIHRCVSTSNLLLYLRRVAGIFYFILVGKSSLVIAAGGCIPSIYVADHCKVAVIILYYHRQRPLAGIVRIACRLGIGLLTDYKGISSCLCEGDLIKGCRTGSLYKCRFVD